MKQLTKMIGSLTAKFAALLLAFTCVGSAWGALSGTGTEADPFQIATLANLQEFRDAVNAGTTYEGQYVKLTADIDLSAVDNWTPIGEGTRKGAGNCFAGTFDGNGKSISGLTITSYSKGTDYAVGLFGLVKGGTVKDFTMTAVSIAVGDSQYAVGSAVGAVYGSGMVSGVSVTSGSVTGGKGVGGVVGMVTNGGTVSGCSNAATVKALTYNSGGVVGSAYCTTATTAPAVENCSNSGSVSGKTGVGGVVGLSSADITGCSNTASVTGNGTSIGGVIGEQKSYGTVSGNTNSGNVTNNGGDYGTGGIIGWIRYQNDSSYVQCTRVSVLNNTNTGSVSGGNDAGGIVGTVYHTALVSGNTNKAQSLSGTVFAAGIVGNYQIGNVGAAYEPADNTDVITISGNTSETAAANITAGLTSNIVYDNSQGAHSIIVGNTPSNQDKANVVASATVNGVTTAYASLMEAINAAYNGGTVEVLADVTVEHWHQNIWTLVEEEGDFNTSPRQREPLVGPNNLTIHGNGHTLTVNAIDSAGNGNRLFSGAKNLNIDNYTIDVKNGAGIGMDSGTLDTVSIKTPNGNTLLPGANCPSAADYSADIAGVTVKNCTLDGGTGSPFYVNENGRAANFKISGSTLKSTSTGTIAILRGNEVLEDCTIESPAGSKITLTNGGVAGPATITGNNFGETGLKIYSANNCEDATIAGNVFSSASVIKRDGTDVVNLSENYWSDGSAPSFTDSQYVVVDSYYQNYDTATGTLSNLYEVPPVATVTINETTTKYTDLNKALTAAVTAGQDATVTICAENFENKTLDLSGSAWSPVSLNANNGGKFVTVEGSGAILTGLSDMLFSGTWAGKTGLVIKDLTIKDSTIVHDAADAKGDVGVGAFIGWPQATETVTLSNCHLVNSKVEGGHWTGGLIGIAAGYSGTDGPVFETVTITGCSVENSTITGKGSAGGIIGHGAASDWTKVIITDTTVTGNTVKSTGSSGDKAGAVCGTVGAAGQEKTVNGVTHEGGIELSADVSNNTVTSGTTDKGGSILGRIGSQGGELAVTGGSYDGTATYANDTYDSANGKIVISGGSFKTAPSADAVVEGFVVTGTPNAEGYYTLEEYFAAQIGETKYKTLAEAIAAVGAGDVTIELLNDAEFSYPARSAYGTDETTKLTIKGNGHTLNLIGTDTDWSSLGLKNPEAVLAFENMTINKTEKGNGAWNNHALNITSKLEMKNVTVNNSLAVRNDAKLENVDIVEAGGYYGLIITAQGQDVEVKGGSITATSGGRGIKVMDEYVAEAEIEKVAIDIDGTKFTTASKAAVLVTSPKGATITTSNIDISGVAADSTHVAWVDEDRSTTFGETTLNGGQAYPEGGPTAYAATLSSDGKIEGYYKSLDDVVAAYEEGDTITALNYVEGTTVVPEGWGPVTESGVTTLVQLPVVATVTTKSGTTTNYYDLHEALTAGKANGSVVTMVSDVDLNNEPWTPISGFGGTFDGANHKISNLYINLPDQSNVGLFASGGTATFKNFTIVNANVTGYECVAAVFGRTGGHGFVATNITVTGNIKVEAVTTSKYGRVGGIAGGWVYGHFVDCSVIGDGVATSYIKAPSNARYAGGIVGHADAVDEYTRCTVRDIRIIGDWLCGGIAGPGPADTITKDCVVEDVEINADYSGGLFGWFYTPSTQADETKGVVDGCTVSKVSFTSSDSNNGAIGGYGMDNDVVVKNITIEDVHNKTDDSKLISYNVTIERNSDGTEDVYYYSTPQIAVDNLKSDDEVVTVLNYTEGMVAPEGWDFKTESGVTTLVALPVIATVEAGGTTKNYYDLHKALEAGKAAGSVVTLLADVDLAGVAWEPVGVTGDRFSGTFDGNGKKISNLTINDATKDYVGLFGRATKATIKNVSLVNVDITAHDYVGALVGETRDGTCVLQDCSVTGTINLSANHYVGGLAGQLYGAQVSGCSVDGGDAATSIIHAADHVANSGDGDDVGGLAGFAEAATITNCSAKNVTVEGFRQVGGLVGLVAYSTITGANVEDVVVKCIADENTATKKASKMGFGGLVGAIRNTSTATVIDDCAISGVSLESTETGLSVARMGYVTGGLYDTATFDVPSTANLTVTDITVENCTRVPGTLAHTVTSMMPVDGYLIVAAIGDTYYTTFAEAIADAQEGDTVKLLVDESEDAVVTINNDVTIDLNGKTVTLPGFEVTNGNVEFKNGKVVGSTKASSTFQLDGGNVTLTGLEVVSLRHAVRIEGASVVIDGGSYSVPGTTGTTTHAINIGGGSTHLSTLLIKDGTFIGPKGTVSDSGAALNVQNNAKVTVEGGLFKGGKNNTVSVKTNVDNLSIAISGGYFDQQVNAANCADDYQPKSETVQIDNVPYYTVETKGAAKDENGVYYATLRDAVTSTTSGDTITLLKDVTENISSFSRGSSRNTKVLKLNGFTVTGQIIVDWQGILDVDGGKVEYPSGTAVTLQSSGTMVMASGEVTGKVGISTVGGSKVTISGGKVSGVNNALVLHAGVALASVSGGEFINTTGTTVINGWQESYNTSEGLALLREEHRWLFTDNIVAKDENDVVYAMLENALTASTSGSQITLLADVTETVTYGKGKTLRLGGKTITGGLTVTSTGILDMSNGKIVNPNGRAVAVNNGGRVIFSGGEITGSSVGLHTEAGATIEIKGGTITGMGTSALSLNNSTIGSISGGNYVSTTENTAFNNNYRKYLAEGYVAQVASSTETATTVKVFLAVASVGGQYFETLAAAIAAAKATDPYGTINVVNKELADTQYAGLDFATLGAVWEFAGNATDGYTLVPAVASISGTPTKYFATLAAAFAAAADGDTIKLLKSSAGNGIQVLPGRFATYGLTVDFGGFTYTVDGDLTGSAGTQTQAFQLQKNNKITFTSSAEAKGVIYSAKAKMLINNYCDLTLDKMTLTLDNPDYAYGYTLSDNNGNVVINDTTINANPAGAVAFDVCRGGGSGAGDTTTYPSVHVTVTGNSVINGDVELDAKSGLAAQGFGLTLEGGTMNGEIKFTTNGASALENEPEKVVVAKKSTFEQAPPTGYLWSEADANGVQTLAKGAATVTHGETVTTYATLAAAFAVAADGDTVTLLQNVTLTDRLFVNAGATPAFSSNGRYATTSENKSITLDLNGKNITSASNIALAGGSLNITGTGKISTTNDGLAPIEVRGTGDLEKKRMLTIGSGVTLNSTNSSYGLNVFGSNSDAKNLIDVTVNGTVNGTLFVLGNLKNAENAINIVVNGTVAAPAGKGDNVNVGIALNGNANVTVNAPAVVSGDSGIEVRAGTLTVNGGTITGTAETYSYKANGSGSSTKGAAIAVAQHGTALDTAVTLNGGTPNGVKTIGVTDVNGNMDNVSVVATQGYTQSSAIPDGYKWVETETAGKYTLAPMEYVAQVGTAKYESLAEAFDAAQDGDTVKLLKNVELAERLFVNAGAEPMLDSKSRYATTSDARSLTLDMNGFNITSESNIALAGGSLNITGTGKISTTNDGLAPIEVRGTGDLTSKRMLTIGSGVTLDSTSRSYGLNVFGSNSDAKNLIDVTVDGTVNGTLFVLGNLTNPDNEINIVVNGTVAAPAGEGDSVNVGVALNGNAKVTVNAGATVSGDSGIEVRAGMLTVNGGTITGTAETYSYKANGSGSSTKGAAIAVAQHGTALDTAVTLNGGTPNGVKTIGVTDVNGNMDKVSVHAKQDYTAGSSIPEDYKWVESDTEGMYKLVKKDYVAQVVREEAVVGKYESLAEAILAAQDGDTIEILDGTWGADAVGVFDEPGKYTNAQAVRAKSLTIQAAEGAKPKFTADVKLGYDDGKTANATMTVKGLAFENAKLSLVNYVQATVEDCTFTGSGANAALFVGDSCDKKHLTSGDYPADQVTIKDCTFNGTAAGSPAIRVRNGGNVTITGNTVENSAHNGILLESNTAFDNTAVKTVTITGNTITEWNADNVAEGGRGIRASLGGLAEGSTVTVKGNIFRKENMGLDKPDYVKITGAGSAAVDISGNDWNNMLLSEVKDNGAVYTSDATTTTITSVITTRKEPVAQIGTTKYETLQDANAASQSGDTIELLKDVEIEDRIVLKSGVTLDGKNKTISPANSPHFTPDAYHDGYNMFEVSEGVTDVTIKNVTITSYNSAEKREMAPRHLIAVSGQATVQDVTLHQYTVGFVKNASSGKRGADALQTNGDCTIAGALSVAVGTEVWSPISLNNSSAANKVRFADGATLTITEDLRPEPQQATIRTHGFTTTEVIGADKIGYVAVFGAAKGTNCNQSGYEPADSAKVGNTRRPGTLYNYKATVGADEAYYTTFALAATVVDTTGTVENFKAPAGDDVYALTLANTPLKVIKNGFEPNLTVPEGYELLFTTAEGGVTTYTIGEGVATITTGGVTRYYASLQNAVDAAVAGDTVKLLVDTTIKSITVDKEIILDLNEKTVSSDGVDLFYVTSTGDLTITGKGTVNGPTNGQNFDGKALISVYGGKLTIENGTFIATGSGSDGMYGVYVYNNGTATFGKADGTGPTITSYFAAIGTNNTTAPAHITVNGGTYTANAAPTNNEWWSYFCAPVYAASAGDFTLNGGTFNGYYGISSRYANVDQDVMIDGDVVFFASSFTQVFVDEQVGSAGISAREIFSNTNKPSVPAGWTWVATEADENVFKLTKQYMVTFVAADGTTVIGEPVPFAEGTAAEDVRAAAPAVVPPAGYTLGWTPQFEVVVSNTTYTATYTLGAEFIYPVGEGGVKIDRDWIDEVLGEGLVTDGTVPGSAEYTAAITALSTPADNGIPWWQNYVLGLTGAEGETLKIWGAAPETVEKTAAPTGNYVIFGELKAPDGWKASHVKIGTKNAKSGYTVNANYRLAARNADGTFSVLENATSVPVVTTVVDENEEDEEGNPIIRKVANSAPELLVPMGSAANKSLAVVIQITVDSTTTNP